MNPEGNIQNLRPIQKGQALVGAGRKKKGQSMTEILRKLLDEKVEDPETGRKITRKESICVNLLKISEGKKAFSKDSDIIKATEMVFDRTEGKALQTIDANITNDYSNEIIVFE